ncbi:MAG TPA: hypothetical protein DCR04_01620 [Flavobacteriales bacterium]|nr:hypothetical protein [Flavobacteriales bacterium]
MIHALKLGFALQFRVRNGSGILFPEFIECSRNEAGKRYSGQPDRHALKRGGNARHRIKHLIGVVVRSSVYLCGTFST